jgi:Rod binding domain-containing protein
MSSSEEKKLRKAATEFEAMLLSSWWSAMKQSGLPGGEDDSDPGRETLDQLGMQAMSAAVAKGGGIGIGNMLVRSLLGSGGAGKTNGSKPAAGQVVSTYGTEI